MLPVIIAAAASAASSAAAEAAKTALSSGATGLASGISSPSAFGAKKMGDAAQNSIKGAIRTASNYAIGEDTTKKLSDIADSVEPGQGGGGGERSMASQAKAAAAPQASPVYSEAAPKQRLADVSQQVHKVEAPPRYYGGFGAAAPIQQQKEQPEPFNMGQYFAGQLSAFRGK